MSFHRTRIYGLNLIKQLKELFLEEKKTWLVFQVLIYQERSV